jgi:hypothetical protein
VVNGTFARGGVFLPELALEKHTSGGKRYPCVNCQTIKFLIAKQVLMNGESHPFNQRLSKDTGCFAMASGTLNPEVTMATKQMNSDPVELFCVLN